MKTRTMICYALAAFVSISAVFSEDDGVPPLFLSLPDPVAQLGDLKISRSDFAQAVSAMVPAEQLQAMGKDRLLENFPQILSEIINRRIMLVLAEKDGIKAGTEMAKDQIDKEFKLLPTERQESFRNDLKAKGIALEEYMNKISQDRNLQQQIAIDKWTELVRNRMSATDDEVRRFHAQSAELVTASHILVAPENPGTEAKRIAKAKADGLLKRIRGGEDFDKLAVTESSCHAENGRPPGDLGEFPRGNMVKEFDEAAFKLKAGEISNVVESPYGFHIIRVNAVRTREIEPYEKIKEAMKDKLLEVKVQDYIIDGICEFKRNNEIRIFLEKQKAEK